MKIRDIDFDGLATRYDGWQSLIEILFKESGQRYCIKGFDRAEEYLTSHDYLDRECEIQPSLPVDYRLDKCVRLGITIEPKPYTNVTTNEERKMKVKDIDFKRLQKENEKWENRITVTFKEGPSISAKEFTSFTALKNYLTSHPKCFEYADSQCIFRLYTEDSTDFRRSYRLEIAVKQKETPKVPYYQFCDGNVCNVNGTTYAPEIKDVIFNPPATIVKWADGTKSVVKVDNSEAYDPEKGLAMAIARKMYGNKYDYYNVFKKWLKKFDDNAAKKALAKVAKSVVDAWQSNPASEKVRELEETNAKLKKCTGYDSKELLDLFAEGFTLVKETELEPNYPVSKAVVEEIHCKDCEHFVLTDCIDPWEDDGVCKRDNKGTYTMNSCDKAVKKSE